MKALLIFLMMGSLQVHAVDFDVREQEEGSTYVCKYRDGYENFCGEALQSSKKSIRIDIIARLQAYKIYLSKKAQNPAYQATQQEFVSFGGAFLLSAQEVDEILNAWEEISVRNITIMPYTLNQDRQTIYIPFYASVRWKGKSKWGGVIQNNGTLGVEGNLKVPRTSGHLRGLSENSPDFRNELTNFVDVRGFSDSSTEMQFEWMRSMESSARADQFTTHGGEGTPTAGAIEDMTFEFLQQKIAPMVVYEVGYAPIRTGAVKNLEDLLKIGMAKAFVIMNGNFKH